jgi:CheY-like chemotaxis protein
MAFHILIVDDSPAMRQVVRRFCKISGSITVLVSIEEFPCLA